MKCKQCGKVNEDKAKFCMFCGASLIDEKNTIGEDDENSSLNEKEKSTRTTVIVCVIAIVVGIICLTAMYRKTKYDITEEKVVDDFLAAESSEESFTERTGIDITDSKIVMERTTDDTNYLEVVLYGEKEVPSISYEIKLDMTYHLYKQGWLLDEDYEIEDVIATPHEGPEDDRALKDVKENPDMFLDAKNVEADSISGECVGEYLELEEDGDSRNYCQKHINITVDYEYVTLQAVVCVNYIYCSGKDGGGVFGSWQIDNIFISGEDPSTYAIKEDKNVIGYTFTDPYGNRPPVTINSVSEDMTTANVTYDGVTEDVKVEWSDYSEVWTLHNSSLSLMIDFSPYEGVTVRW